MFFFNFAVLSQINIKKQTNKQTTVLSLSLFQLLSLHNSTKKHTMSHLLSTPESVTRGPQSGLCLHLFLSVNAEREHLSHGDPVR